MFAFSCKKKCVHPFYISVVVADYPFHNRHAASRIRHATPHFFPNTPNFMTDKTFELIRQFHPQPIQIPLNKQELETVIDTLIGSLFPIGNHMPPSDTQHKLLEVARTLHLNIAALCGEKAADEKTEAFFGKLSALRECLYRDAFCYLHNDPAAKTLEEVLITYPGFYALCVYRLAHEIHLLGLPLMARLFSEHAHSKVGIDIHPAATIGENLFMDHGTGIVVGETTRIGDNVKIYQGVTLGALYVEKRLSDVKRHPTVEENVVIYANATILGGETVIGHDSTIGGGAWITRSIAPYSLVYNTIDIKIRTLNK